MVAIAGLLVVGVPYIGKMGLGAAIAIGAVVVSALTILPIMMGAFGRRLVPKRPEHVQASPAFTRWGEIVTRRPWVSIAGGVAVLLVFAAPGHPDAHRPARRRQPARVAHAARRLRPAHRGVRPGLQRPVPARRRHAEGRAGHRRQQLAALQQAVAGTPGIAAGAARDGERGRRDGDDLRHPHHGAAGRQDLRPARPPARRRHPGGDRRHAAEGLRGRQHRRLRGRHGQGRRAPAAVHLGRDRPLGAAAGDGVPLAVDPARLGASSTCCRSRPPTASSWRCSRRASARA